MIDINTWDIAQSILASIGGGALLVAACSSWLAKLMSKRIIQNEQAQHTSDLEELKAKLKKETDAELVKLQVELKKSSDFEIEKLKLNIDKYSHDYKLDKTHEHEQKKKIKDIISRHKVTLINAAETLDSRLCNFMQNHERNWHVQSSDGDKYYLNSFVYRVLIFFGVSHLIEKDMIYLDSTIADKQDLDFLKFLKVFQLIMTEVSLFDGHGYNPNKDTDHFFKDNFIAMVSCILNYDSETHLLKSINSFEEFVKNKDISEKANKLAGFISGSNPSNTLRWCRILSLHLIIKAFLEEFGYDFNKLSDEALRDVKKQTEINVCYENLWTILKYYKLDKNQSILKVFSKD